MKRVYLVRHGQSEANAGISGIGNSILTRQGIEQATMIAERCGRLPIDVIVSSPLKRAYQTAEAVRNTIKKEIIVSDLFVERRAPTACEGMTEEEWEPTRVIIDNSFSIPGYRYSDEENYDDMNKRAQSALDFLLSLDYSNIVVVTHGIFKRMLVGRALFGDDLTGKIFQDLLFGLRTQNTGLTMIEYEHDESRWQVMTWNDYAHLG